jgi:hypothetical protein
MVPVATPGVFVFQGWSSPIFQAGHVDTADTPRKAFYKKDHRWKDGLVSAAQAVGWCANVLVDTVAEALTSIEAGEGTWFFHRALCFALTYVFAFNQTRVWILNEVIVQPGKGRMRTFLHEHEHISLCDPHT